MMLEMTPRAEVSPALRICAAALLLAVVGCGQSVSSSAPPVSPSGVPATEVGAANTPVDSGETVSLVTTYLETESGVVPLPEEVSAIVAIERAGGDVFAEKDVHAVHHVKAYNTGVTDDIVAKLPTLKQIRILDLGWCERLTDKSLESIRGMEVEELNLEGDKFSPAALVNLVEMHKLKKLNINRVNVTDAGLEYLSQLPGLEVLILEQTNCTDAGVAHLAKLNNLKALELADNRLTSASLVHLRAMTKLEAVALNSSDISDDGLEVLAELPKLNNIGLQSTKISDAGVEKLAKTKELTHLYVGFTGITDASVPTLKSLTNLKVLDLTKTRISELAYKDLRKALPDTLIYFVVDASNASPETRRRYENRRSAN